jgi:hypothetical protein
MTVAKKNSSEKEAVTQQTTDAAKSKAIELAITSIEKQFGKGSIMRLGKHWWAPGRAYHRDLRAGVLW